LFWGNKWGNNAAGWAHRPIDSESAAIWPIVISLSTGAVSGVATVYNRYGYLNEKRAALEAWSEEMTKIIDARNSIEIQVEA
jgi:hypothetical protein